MVIAPAFWARKRVLVTGHTGFKGSWLSLWLQTFGATVTGYAKEPPTQPSLYEVARINEGMGDRKGDVSDFDELHQAFAQIQPDIVFHLAAQSLVRYGYENPLETYTTNVLGTANVLECARRSRSVRVVVIVTSDKCYENQEWIWGYREDDPMGGFDPYSNSKGCAELVVSAFRRSYFSPRAGDKSVGIASVRSGNVIGGGDWAADRLVPDMMRSIAVSRPVSIRNPAAVRPWQHVLDPLRGYLMLAQRLWDDPTKYAEAWNFGPADDDARTVSWLVECLLKRWSPEATWRVDDNEQPHEAYQLKLDCSKARTRLSWRPLLPLERAVDWIVDWHKAYIAGKNMRAVTESQIRAYQCLENL